MGVRRQLGVRRQPGARRPLAAAGLAAGAALALAACGVQPTGVNIANASPFSVSRAPEPTPASSAGGSGYKVSIFLVPKTPGQLREVTRWVPQKPTSPLDLLPELWRSNVSGYDSQDNLTSSVEQDFTLRETKNAHEYVIEGNLPSSFALNQLTCTFDAWWQLHDNANAASTQFRYEGEVIRSWDDCQSLLGEGTQASPSPPPGKISKPTAIAPSSAYGN